MKKNIIFSLLFFTSLFAESKFDSFYVHQLESGEKNGKILYDRYCAGCHHKERIGVSGPPLLPAFIRKISDKKLHDIIKNSLPQTLMPKFDFLSSEDIDLIVKYLRQPAGDIKWDITNIEKSIVKFDKKAADLGIENIENVTPVVERGANRIWIMENEKLLDFFNFKNVHGGLKYTMDGKNLYIPTRDGWVGRYQLDKGRLHSKVRACVNLRNISLSRDGKTIFATCLLPQSVVMLDSQTLKPLKMVNVDGKISALYELYSKDIAIFSFRDKPLFATVDTKTFDITYQKLDAPIEDFFIDPFEEYIIGTTRRGSRLGVYEIDSKKKVFEEKIEGMPHLFSATYWYRDGKFYFATPHLRKPYVTIWQMYDWKLVKKINIDGDGFFVKTHPASKYLWADNGTDKIVLIDKENYKIKTFTPMKGKRFIHTEFNAAGNIAYLSIYESDGALQVIQTDTMKELVRYEANVPVGKYNFVNKNRVFYPRLFGQSIFKEKCWGCHHQTSEAFGPSFSQIAKTRTEGEMISQIVDPVHTYKQLGYKRNLMPAFKLNEKELKSIVEYIKSCREK
ncbi:cytochrome D1 domain-containing protein [Nitrosophilus alvini]|uniref:cytochrome D1 domain-containing protein n=1 Tax=Nitrosophilus alvini TaxID=2714855 RepID=UPI00190D64CA|nr:cytochrome D1 domain-containing protein [Nitrosophilus alvini]